MMVFDCFRIVPRKVVEAYRSAYRSIGGDLWVGARLPGWMKSSGMEVERIEPHMMAGPPHSPMFRWVSRFLLEHLSTVVRDGHLSEDDAQDFVQAWSEAETRTDTVLFSPIQVTVVGRQPKDG